MVDEMVEPKVAKLVVQLVELSEAMMAEKLVAWRAVYLVAWTE